MRIIYCGTLGGDTATGGARMRLKLGEKFLLCLQLKKFKMATKIKMATQN